MLQSHSNADPPGGCPEGLLPVSRQYTRAPVWQDEVHVRSPSARASLSDHRSMLLIEVASGLRKDMQPHIQLCARPRCDTRPPQHE